MKTPATGAVARCRALRLPAPLVALVFASLAATTVHASAPPPNPFGSAATTSATASTWSGNYAPKIWGSPSWKGYVNTKYSFTPQASDADSDQLTFRVAHKPWWAYFDAKTGRLWGTPPRSAVGKYLDVTISVSDGAKLASLSPFNIVVTDPAATGSVTLSWIAPTKTTTGTVLTNLAGFKVRYGTDSSQLGFIRTYWNPGVERAVIDELKTGRWYFTISAFTTTGAESSRSSIVSTYVDG